MRRLLQLVALVTAVSLSGCSGSSSAPAAAPPPTTHGTTHPASTVPAVLQRLRAHVVGRLPAPASRAVAVYTGEHIVVLGGLTSGDVTTGRVVTINAQSWTAAIAGQLREAVHDASGASLAGRAVVFGGGASSEVADTQAWTGGTSRIVGALPSARSDSAAVTIGTTAYVAGGFDGSGMARAVLATTDGRSFRTIARLRQGVRYPAVTSFGRAIYVFGGELATTDATSAGGQSRLVQRVDPGSGRTSVVGRLPWGIGHAMAFDLGGALYLAGGRLGTRATARIWRVDPTSARLTPAGRLPQAISDSAVVRVGNAIVLIGGETAGPFAPQSTIVAVSR